MSVLFERVSYLKGLAEGLEIQESSKEGKMLLKIVEVLDEFALAIDDLDYGLNEVEETLDEVEEFVEMVDEDLSDLEDDFYGNFEEDFEEFECPECGEIVFVDMDYNHDSIECPNCGTTISLGEFEEANA